VAGGDELADALVALDQEPDDESQPESLRGVLRV